ncbi:alpha-hydroxy-acid oxidizing protein [Arthrobacter wenxiniae]|uniref:alpha-hydroxy-acid oxidizing protein n=1 Tax=Arthrobacter wenxiniae TaxID=2713570 RepID=UPI001C3FFF21|nr:alpha-hydroxy-acid oxidizing protein [Arthrobacter wenxiniae]
MSKCKRSARTRHVGDQTDALIDGGIHRSSEIVKAMALGAKAVGIGRAYVKGLPAAGEPVVMRMVDLLRDRMIDSLRFLGVDTPPRSTPRSSRSPALVRSLPRPAHRSTLMSAGPPMSPGLAESPFQLGCVTNDLNETTPRRRTPTGWARS